MIIIEQDHSDSDAVSAVGWSIIRRTTIGTQKGLSLIGFVLIVERKEEENG